MKMLAMPKAKQQGGALASVAPRAFNTVLPRAFDTVLPLKEPEEPPAAEDPGAPSPPDHSAIDENRCRARIWGDHGAGGQCQNKRKGDTEYCGRHMTEDKRKHGRVDSPMPDFMQKHQNKKPKVQSGPSSAQGRAPADLPASAESAVGQKSLA